MSSIKFLLDENVDDAFRKGLLQRHSDLIVWRVNSPSAPPINTLDPAILIWCQEHGFALVTKNRASMPVHLSDHLAQDRHIPGIFLNPPNTPPSPPALPQTSPTQYPRFPILRQCDEN